jgi:hypothetical protein
MNLFRIAVLGLSLILTACVSKPPSNLDNVCHIFRQYPSWYHDAKDVEHRWRVPVSVQMAIMHQESKFNARAKPGYTHFLWVIPWKRQSTAYGYAQGLDGTWDHYKKYSGYLWSTRSNFANGADFIGWYANMANRRAHIPRTDAYLLYLAYHEGVGGYQRKTYLKKPWLIQVARKVKARSQIYEAQLKQCKRR